MFRVSRKTLAAIIISSLLIGSACTYLISGYIPNVGPYYLDVPFGVGSFYFGKFQNGTSYAVNGDNWKCEYTSSNSTEVAQSCIDNISPGGAIYFRHGVYYLNMVINRSDIKLVGEGYGNGTYLRNDQAGPVINITGSATHQIKNIILTDINIQNSTASNTYGIYATWCVHKFTLERVSIWGFNTAGLSSSYCWGISLLDCKITSNPGGGVKLYRAYGGNLYGTYLINNGGTSSENLWINHTASFTVDGCIIENSAYGVVLDELTVGTTISNCQLEVSDEGYSLIEIRASATYPSKNTVIENSFFTGKTQEWPDCFIHLGNASETKIENNYFSMGSQETGVSAAINLTSDAEFTYILNNDFGGSATKIVNDGSSTICGGYGFEGYGVLTNVANGSYVAHSLYGTPDIVSLTLTMKGYAWVGARNSTHFQVYASVDPLSGYWVAEYDA